MILRERIESELNLCAVVVSRSDAAIADLGDDGDQDQEGVYMSAADRDLDDATLALYTDPKVRRIISYAMELFATRYKWGGENIRKGIDCSFFVQYIFSRLGVALPRTSREQFKVGRAVAREDLRCGDLVFFKTLPTRAARGRAASAGRINHVAIYLKDGEFIHAARGCNRVTITSLNEQYYDRHFAGGRRVLD
jgi:cell wall-associated NlpC family hydrolase